MLVCCIKQGSRCEFPDKCLQLLEKKFIYKHGFQNLTIMLLLNIKVVFFGEYPGDEERLGKIKTDRVSCTDQLL